MRFGLAIGISLLVWALAPVAARAATPADDPAAHTVILVNARQRDSVELGEFYAERRGIPRDNIIALPMPETETINRRDFIDQIWQPLQDELLRRGWFDGKISDQRDELGRRRNAIAGHRLAFLVVCRGTPLRVEHDGKLEGEVVQGMRRGTEQFQTNRASVDAELSLLPQPNLQLTGFMRNPLFNQRQVARITEELIVKVARLDGPTFADARQLVTSALTAEKQGLIGRYYVDLKGPHAAGDRWLESTRDQLVDLGYFGDVHAGPGTFDAADRFDAPVLYFGWYSANINGPFLRPGFRFPPGAIAFHIHSYSAGSLRATNEQWCGPFVSRGVAVTFGNVYEPYLELTARPDLLLARLSHGAPLGDAAYFATPVLGWQSVVIGDPLYRPFKVSLEQQVAQLRDLPAELAGHVVARQAAVLDKLNMGKEARALFTQGMRDFPSLALALAGARYELMHERPKEAARMLGFLAVMREFTPADWPLARAGAEIIAQHGSAREALPIYRTLVRAGAPTLEVRARALAEARKVADTVGDMSASLEFGRMASEVATEIEVQKAAAAKARETKK